MPSPGQPAPDRDLVSPRQCSSIVTMDRRFVRDSGFVQLRGFAPQRARCLMISPAEAANVSGAELLTSAEFAWLPLPRNRDCGALLVLFTKALRTSAGGEVLMSLSMVTGTVADGQVDLKRCARVFLPYPAGSCD